MTYKDKTKDRKKRKPKKYIRFTDGQVLERTKRIKAAILEKYPSIDMYIGRKGIKLIDFSSGAIAVYLKLCSDFALDPFDLGMLNAMKENRKENLLENRILSMYCDLNMEGRERFFEMLYDLWCIDKYRRI